MKKTYRFAFHPLIYVLAGLITALFSVVIVIDTLKLLKVGNFASANFGLDLGAVLISVIMLIIVGIFMFGSNYRIGENQLTYRLGLYRYRVEYKHIRTILEEKNTHTLVLHYERIIKDKDGKECPALANMLVNISSKKNEKFIADLRDKNHAIVYEIIDKNIED